MDDILRTERHRTVVITGADRGLGLSLVREYLKRGDHVFAGRYKTNWHDLERLKEEYPDLLDIVMLDVGNDESVALAASYILSKTFSVDILLNVAGVWMDQNSGSILSDRLDYQAMMTQYNINALGAIRVTHALIHAILASFDQVVCNISSEAGSLSDCKKQDQFGYCMSKAALNMASCIMLNGCRDAGLQVINIHPGWMQSVIGDSVDANAPHVDPARPGSVKFYTTPDITARGILKILDEPERFSGRMPGFVNYRGDRMQW